MVFLFCFQKGGSRSMELHEQLKKIENDLKKMEEKKKNFLEEYEARRKKLLGKKQAVLDQITKEKNEKILSAIEKSFGILDETNLEEFLEFLEKNRKVNQENCSLENGWNHVQNQIDPFQ